MEHECDGDWHYFKLASTYRLIGLVGRVLPNSLGDLGSISGRVIPKTFKMVLDTCLLNTQQNKVRIKSSGAIQGKEYRPLLHIGVVTIEKGTFWSPFTTVANNIGIGISKHLIFLLLFWYYSCVVMFLY